MQGKGSAAGVDDYGRKHSEWMSPDVLIGIGLLCVADIRQFADETERAIVAECEMVNPIDEPGSGVIAQLMGQLRDHMIPCGERIDGPRYPAGRGGLRFPDELVLPVGDGSFGVLHGSFLVLRMAQN